MSNADINHAMKQFSFLSSANRRFGKKCVFIPLLLSFFATFCVHSSIRLVGPQQESPEPRVVQKLSSLAEQISEVNRPLFLGPTRINETLWSIATQYSPKNDSVTLYQTIGAIFRLNPSAFKNDNIHGLRPDSLLLMPTLSQIRAESTADIAQRLQNDKTRKKGIKKASKRPVIKQVPKDKTSLASKVSSILPKVKMTPPAPAITSPLVDVKEKENVRTDVNENIDTTVMPKKAVQAPVAKTSPLPLEKAKEKSSPAKPQMGMLQKQIDGSDLQMSKLIESNHIMKIRIAEIKHELLSLKKQMMEDGKLTKEIRVFLDAQRRAKTQILAEEEEAFLGLMLASPLILMGMTVIPALIVIGAAFYILRRRKEGIPEEIEKITPDESDKIIPENMPVIMLPDEDDDDDDLENLILEDDDLNLDETPISDSDTLFEDEDENADPINLSEPLAVSEEPAVDIDNDIAFSSENPLDENVSTKSDENLENAIGLEDIDRMQDDSEDPSEAPLSPDETMAAMEDVSLGSDESPLEDIEIEDIELEDDIEIDDLSKEAQTDELEAQNEQEDSDTPPKMTEKGLDLLDTLLEGADDNQDEPPLDLLSLPEYDEQSALKDSEFLPDTELNLDLEPEGWDNEPLDLSDLPEYTEDDAASDFNLTQPNNEQSALKAENESSLLSDLEIEKTNKEGSDGHFTATQINTLAFPSVETIGLDELGEFDETDAFDAALAEQRELDGSAPPDEKPDFHQGSAVTSQHFIGSDFDPFSDFDDDARQVSGLNLDTLLFESNDDDEQNLPPFDLDELETPDAESNIWSAKAAPEPELESEDWSEQPEILDDYLQDTAFESDLEKLLDDDDSELVDRSLSNDGYISIEELMKDDGTPQDDPDSLPLDLEVGLEDFPDVLSDIELGDTDAGGEPATQMDLAKAYLEMNDIDGALELLEKVAEADNEPLKVEAMRMIENLN